MIDFLLDLISFGLRYGLSWLTLGLATIALFKSRKLRKRLNRFLPPLLRDDQDSEVSKYIQNQIRIESKLDLLLEERGITWHAEQQTLEKPHRGLKLPFGWITKYPARAAKLFTARVEIDPLKLSRRKKIMKWLKPDKLTIILGVIITASNEYFGWTLDTANVGAFFFMLFTFFKQQEIVKIVRYAHGLPVAFKINSTKLVFTVLGVLLVALDQVKGMGLGLPEIVAIATFVSGYNIKEGNEDVKKAEQEGLLNEGHISTSEFEG